MSPAPIAVRRLPAVLLLLALHLVQWSSASASETIPLGTEPLPEPDRIAVFEDLTDETGGILAGRIVQGAVAPATWIRLNRDQPEALLPLGDREAVFRMTPGGITVRYGEETHTLEKRGGQLPTLVLDDGSIRLAFSRAFLLRTRAVLAPRSGLLRTGPVGGQSLALFDSRLDGRYNVGEDAYRIGEGPAFAPLRSLLPTSGEVYRIESLTPDGTTLRLAPATVETGRVRFAGPGPPIRPAVVFASEDGATAFATGPASSWTLPAGSYRLLFGLARVLPDAADGTPEALLGLIRPGTCGFRLRPGETRTVSLGAPFTLEPEVTPRDGFATLLPSGIRLRGAGGALYSDLPLQTPAPTMTIRRGDWQATNSACLTCGGGLISIMIPLPRERDALLPGTYEVHLTAAFEGLGPFEGSATVYVPDP